jgi:hypothetical protein
MGKIFNKNIITNKDIIRKEVEKFYKRNDICLSGSKKGYDFTAVYLKNEEVYELGTVSNEEFTNKTKVFEFTFNDIKTNELIKMNIYSL